MKKLILFLTIGMFILTSCNPNGIVYTSMGNPISRRQHKIQKSLHGGKKIVYRNSPHKRKDRSDKHPTMRDRGIADYKDRKDGLK